MFSYIYKFKLFNNNKYGFIHKSNTKYIFFQYFIFQFLNNRYQNIKIMKTIDYCVNQLVNNYYK